MSRRRKHEEEHSIEDAELNLVPYLDIMMNLIMFMLLTFQVVAELRLIQINPPSVGDGGGGGDPQEKPLMITVMVRADGHAILTDIADAGTETVPKKGPEYDFAELTKRIVRLKKDIPNLDENIVVVAEGDVEYEHIVHTLDALRTTADGDDLFPKVTLGLAVGTQ